MPSRYCLIFLNKPKLKLLSSEYNQNYLKILSDSGCQLLKTPATLPELIIATLIYECMCQW